MTALARFTFYDTLNYFLPHRHKHQTIEHRFAWRASVKDMIESLGVPHPEIYLIGINGVSVDFNHIVRDGDDVHVYPVGVTAALRHAIPLIPPYPGRPRFVLDTHLGRLASYLRMMGYDTLYRNDFHDDELAYISHYQKRILLTRDIGALKRSLVIYGYYVRATAPRAELVEVCGRYQLAAHIRPFHHCMKCNGVLCPVDKNHIAHVLPLRILQNFESFHQCQSCRQIYWKGAHYEKMAQLLAELRSSA